MTQTAIQVIAQWGGNVHRWAASPVWQLRESGDTTQSHAKRTASIYLAIWPDASADEISDVLAHDDGESGVGDVSWKAKRLYPELKAAADIAEAERLEALGITLRGNAARKSIADGIDALLWAQSRAPHVMSEPDFLGHITAIHAMAIRLDVGPRVAEILRAGGVKV